MKRHAKRLIRILENELDTPVRIGCEVGVWRGGLSFALMDHFPLLHLLMVDRFEVCVKIGRGAVSNMRQQSEFFDVLKKTAEDSLKYADRRTLMVSDSVRAAAWIPDELLDFCFIDADHRYEETAKDIAAWCPKVRMGGVLCGHDYGAKLGDVRRAVDEFVDDRTYDLHVNSSTRVWWCRIE